jgi:hypothetical protein
LGIADSREFERQPGCPQRGNALEKKSYLISWASRPRDCTCVEEAMKQFCLGAVVAAGLTLPAFGQGVDPPIGTWKLNLEKSTFTGAVAPPKSATATWAGEGQNLIDTNEGVDAQGQPFKIIFRHIYDRMPHPTTGSPDYETPLSQAP